MSIVEKLTGLISEITQLEKDNKTLNEQLLVLESDKSEGYKSFNTESHILLKREDLDDLISALDNLECTSDNTKDEIESAQSRCDDASYTARNAYDEARECRKDLENIIANADKKDEEDK